MKVEFELFCNL